ncbi:MAG: hypothetical protein C0467_18080 [Planctomycetaceae bacterium]|nr:hypothetical protein [Planctomycetaceae bacterium]
MQVIQGVFQPVLSVDEIESDPDAGVFQLHASGGGFFARLFGMGTNAIVTIEPSGFRLQKTTFGAVESVYVPLSHIASTVRIISKPLEFLVLGLFTLPIWGLGLIFLIVYLFSKKRLIIGVVSSGGTVESLKVKADDKTIKDIRNGGKILEALINQRSSQMSAVAAEPVPVPRAAPVREEAAASPPWMESTVVTVCPSCGSRQSVSATSVGRRIRCANCREAFTAAQEG